METASTVRALDVGYGNTKFTTGSAGRRVDCQHFPSIAPLASPRHLTEALGSTRRTIELEIDGVRYEVGPDAALAQGAFSARNMDDDFCMTAEYLALVRGALHFMEVDRIALLIVGLPVSNVGRNRSYLERRLTGQHPLDGGRAVDIQCVKVLAQPRGALLSYASASGRRGFIREQKSLIIDCGARTFDWLVVDGFKVNDKRSGAVNRGMYDVLTAIAEGIDREFCTRFTDFERIERALRGTLKLQVFGRMEDLGPHLAAARKIASDAVTAMRRQVQDASDVDNIVVSGGGADFFSAAIQAAFPRHAVQRLPDCMYANVRGFQLAGEQYIQDASRRTVQSVGV